MRKMQCFLIEGIHAPLAKLHHHFGTLDTIKFKKPQAGFNCVFYVIDQNVKIFCSPQTLFQAI